MTDKYTKENERIDQIPLQKFDFAPSKIFEQGFNSSTKKEEIEFVRKKISDKWVLLDNKAHEAELNAERFLFTISFGGIIGLITLFRLYPALKDSGLALTSLILLFSVCISVGFLKAMRIIRDYEKKAGYEKDMLAFYNDQISFDQLQHRDFYRCRKQKGREFLAWISFLAYGIALSSLFAAIYFHEDFSKQQPQAKVSNQKNTSPADVSYSNTKNDKEVVLPKQDSE
jgi:hypothetical protein